MTTEELIEILEKLPPKTKVYLADWSEGYAPLLKKHEIEYIATANMVVLGNND